MSGMTLLELTVVVIVLLALISIMFVGAKAWKRGSDRTSCLLTLRNFQVATRSYQNLHGYRFGDRLTANSGAESIPAELYAKGFIGRMMFDQAAGAENCPGGGAYSTEEPDQFPAPGEMFLKCSLGTSEEHEPNALVDW
jgi:type II secretory pathway pseudopilin PulG